MGLADLHMHTCHDSWGDGNDTVAELFAYVDEHTDLNLIGITDHDSTTAAREGRRLHSSGNYRFGFLAGTEVTTTSGHLLCYFPGAIHDVPSLRSLSSTVKFVHERGGICIIAHPVYPPWLRRSIVQPASRILNHVEGVEIINGGLSSAAQEKLDRVGEHLAGRTTVVGNSDAHHHDAIGSAVTEFPGTSVDDYLAAIRDRQTKPLFRSHVTMPRAARSFTIRRSMTKPGWVRNIYREMSRTQ